MKQINYVTYVDEVQTSCKKKNNNNNRKIKINVNHASDTMKKDFLSRE